MATPSRPAPSRPTVSSGARRGQSQRPMGAVSFAKLALFDQNNSDGDLKPIPRPLPSRNHRWSSEEVRLHILLFSEAYRISFMVF